MRRFILSYPLNEDLTTRRAAEAHSNLSTEFIEICDQPFHRRQIPLQYSSSIFARNLLRPAHVTNHLHEWLGGKSGALRQSARQLFIILRRHLSDEPRNSSENH